jgi:hypothetical protein
VKFYIVFSIIILLFHLILFLNGINLVFDLNIDAIVGLAITMLVPVIIVGLNIFSGDFSKRFLQAVFYLVFHFYMLIPIQFTIPLGFTEIVIDRSIQLGLGFTQKLMEIFGPPLDIVLPLLVLLGFINMVITWEVD